MSVSTCFCNPIGDLAVDPTSGTLIATHPCDCTISILDAEDPVAAVAIRVDGDPVAVAVPPSCVAMGSMMSRLYVADHMGDITALPTATPMLQAAAS